MLVRLSSGASRDLEAISDYIARDDGDRAISFVDDLVAVCRKLGDAPLAYPQVARYGRRIVRKRVHGRYLILYEIVDDEVRVLHIVHGARDWRALLD